MRKLLLAEDGYSITVISLNLGQFSFAYQVNHSQNSHLAKFDESYNQNVPVSAEQNRFGLSVHKLFAVPPTSGPEPTGQNSVAAGYSKIESALSGAVDRFEQFQLGLQTKTLELREEHEKSFAALRAQVNEEKAILEQENANRLSELEAARKELDDRSNTHARRSIRNELKDSVTKSLDQPSSAKNSDAGRRFVRQAYIIAILIMVALAFASLILLSLAITGADGGTTNSTAILLTGIKASIASISTIGLILLYLRWETQWLSQQAAFERMLASTRVDIDRASWVAESLLEWNRVSSAANPMPTELLQSFTRRLFDWDAKVEDHHSAQDSLASAILGSAAKLQIGPNGANIELDKKGIRKLDNG